MKNKYLIIPSIIGIFLIIATGCKKENESVKPTVTTAEVTDITPTTASSGGNITSDGGASIIENGLVWGSTENPTIDTNTGLTTNSSVTNSFTSNLTNLTPGSTYFVRAYATNSAGTGYGSQQTFTTLDGIAILTTNEVSDITLTTATCGGNITADGGASVTVRGVVWSTEENPTVDNYTGLTTNGTGTGSYVSDLTDLTPGTTYFVKAYATNSVGTSYGNEVNFTTLDGIAILTTNEVSDITLTTATCGGNITSDGGALVAARGVVWSTEENPTVDNNIGLTSDGTDTGSFISNLTDLTPGTTYFVKAYATNSMGTKYGDQHSFITYNADAITDYDGNYYNIVTIGNQTWMAENLKVTHYNDGTAIRNVTDDAEWAALSSGAYCWYDNDKNTYKDTYGALYNWYTVETGILAPTGWHVPTDAEWTELTDYLGGEDVAGGKLKETGTIHWTSPNTDATNETGFTALPGGYRDFDGTFYNIGFNGFWWSATEGDSDNAWGRDMYYYVSSVGRSNYSKAFGFSVRCVRD